MYLYIFQTIAYCGNYPPPERSFFPSYLSRTTQNCNATMKAEVMNYVIYVNASKIKSMYLRKNTLN